MTARSVCLVGLIAGNTSGVPRYARALAQALDRVSGEFPDLSLTLLTSPEGARAVAPEHIDVSELPLHRRFQTGPPRLAAEQLALLRHRADLLHFFDLSGPIVAHRRPFVTTAHDATVAHGFNPVRGGYKRRLYPWALRQARAVVAVSQFAKDEVVSHFAAPQERIHVIHSGPGFLPAESHRDDPTPLDESPFLLFVGNLAANKNLPFLVRAFDQADAPARLVLAGRPGEGYRELLAAIAAARNAGRIELRHEVTDAEIDVLYRSARAVVLPSLYEGFGFTPLEAMARGCPVIASDIPAVREVSGAGALLVPPNDLEGWSSALRRVVAEAELRDELRRRGTETVARYSWEDTARAVARLLAGIELA